MCILSFSDQVLYCYTCFFLAVCSLSCLLWACGDRYYCCLWARTVQCFVVVIRTVVGKVESHLRLTRWTQIRINNKLLSAKSLSDFHVACFVQAFCANVTNCTYYIQSPEAPVVSASSFRDFSFVHNVSQHNLMRCFMWHDKKLQLFFFFQVKQ